MSSETFEGLEGVGGSGMFGGGPEGAADARRVLRRGRVGDMRGSLMSVSIAFVALVVSVSVISMRDSPSSDCWASLEGRSSCAIAAAFSARDLKTSI